MNKRKGITLLALVITIVIMLLLAGVAIQMTMGENGLIAKSNQAKKEQAKAELLEDAKLGYLNLKTKAIEEKSPTPEYESLLSTSEFLDKYNIVGDNITDKKGNIIETKQEILNTLKMLYPKTDGKKTVGGVEIPESDKDKMIFKLKIKENNKFITWCNMEKTPSEPMKIDYGDGTKGELIDYYWGSTKEYNIGDYIVKLENVEQFSIGQLYSYQENGYEIEILQWGKIKATGYRNIILQNVSVIHESEPADIIVEYRNGHFSEIPENLFENKKNNKEVGCFKNCNELRIIPENLFKNCINAEKFYETFMGCSNIENIPTNLFKYNTKAKDFMDVFKGCKKIKEIPENLFSNNTELNYLLGVFDGCEGIRRIPSNLLSNSNKLIKVNHMFKDCKNLETIPTAIIDKVTSGSINYDSMFYGCTKADNYNNIPERFRWP